MPRYVVTVRYRYTDYVEDEVEVEAESKHEAESKALDEFSLEQDAEVTDSYLSGE